MEMDSVCDLLAAHPFLAGLSEHQLEKLELCAQRSVIHGGNRIFRQQETADRFWLIIRGEVALDMRQPNGDDLFVDAVRAGSVLGWSWLFAPYRWHFGAVAVQTTLAVELDAFRVRELCERDPALGYLLALGSTQILIERLQATRRRLFAASGPTPQTAIDDENRTIDTADPNDHARC